MRITHLALALCVAQLWMAATGEIVAANLAEYTPQRSLKVANAAPVRDRGSTDVKPQGATSKDAGTARVQRLAAVYAQKPTPDNLKRLQAATDAKRSEEGSAEKQGKAQDAKQDVAAKVEKEERAQEDQAALEAAVKEQQDKISEIKKVMKSLRSPAKKGDFERKLHNAKSVLQLRKSKLVNATASVKAAGTEVTSAKAKAEKAKAALLSEQDKKGDADAAKKSPTGAQEGAATVQVAAPDGFDSRISGLKDLSSAKALLVQLTTQTKKAQQQLKGVADDDAKAAKLKARLKRLGDVVQRVNDKIAVFNAAAEVAATKKKKADAAKDSAKQNKAKAEAAKADAKMAKAKQQQLAEEDKLQKEKKRVEKERAAAVAGEKLASEKALDSALKTKVKAEQSELKQAKKAGDVKQEKGLLAKIEETKLEANKQKDQAKTNEKDIQEAKSALEQAKAEYQSEKVRAEKQIADESPGVARSSEIESEIKKLQDAADKMRTEDFGYGQMRSASQAMADGKDSITTIAKREVVGMARNSKAKAERAIEKMHTQLREAANGDKAATRATTPGTNKDLGEAQSHYEET